MSAKRSECRLNQALVKALKFYPKWLKEPFSTVGHLPLIYWLICYKQPKTFVELGTHTGNFYFSACQAVKENNIDCKCYAIDNWLGDCQAGFYGEEVFNLVQSHNESEYQGIGALIRKQFNDACDDFADDSIDILHIDGLHTYEAVASDFAAWLPKVCDPGIILFHDVVVVKDGFGVHQLWDEINKSSNNSILFPHCNGLGLFIKHTSAELNIDESIVHVLNNKELYRNIFNSKGDAVLSMACLNIENQKNIELQYALKVKTLELEEANKRLAELKRSRIFSAIKFLSGKNSQ